MAQQQGFTEYRVKLTDSSDKVYHVMRFKPPHKCDLEKLTNPTLDRQVTKATVVNEPDSAPTEGEGSEYGRKWKEEVRKKRRGFHRNQDPDDNPWVLKEKKRGGKHFIGRKEGTVNASSSYYILSRGHDGAFEAIPVANWYDFVPPVKYNFLDADEAEEKFERRDKTLNYFSIMLSKRLKGQQEEGEGQGEEGAGLEEGLGSSKKFKKQRRKTKEEEDGLMLTDSDSSGLSSDGDSDEGTRKKKATGRTKKKSQGSEDEAGEETDEGDMESREVDYMSDTSSDSENEFQAKQALREAPKDDEALERQEEGEIDKGFTESSSSSEDELTQEGKEIQALLKMQSTEEEPDIDDSISMEDVSSSPVKAPSKKDSPSKSKKKVGPSSQSSSQGMKRDREPETAELSSPSASSLSGNAADSGSVGAVSSAVSQATQPPAKKHRTEYSLSTITEEEVQRYLKRRPITSNDLVKKFTSKKTEMDKKRVVEVLHQLIQGMKNVEKQTIKGKMYLSLKTSQEGD